MQSETAEIQLLIRGMDGEDKILSAVDLFEAFVMAHKGRLLENHMVRIDIDGERSYRWDRNRFVEWNQWSLVSTSEMELLGRPAKVKFVWANPEEQKADQDEWEAAVQGDNQEFADDLDDELALAVRRTVPNLRKMVIAEYENLGIKALIDELKSGNVSPEIYHRYTIRRDEYTRSFANRFRFLFATEIHRMKHPSGHFADELKHELRDRGFRQIIGGWHDVRGVTISESAWFDHRLIRDPKTGLTEYGWYDPAGIQMIHAKYEKQFARMVHLAAKSEAVVQKASALGGEAYLAGEPLESCPYTEGTLERTAWVEYWEESLYWRADLPTDVRDEHYCSGVAQITFEIEPFRYLEMQA